MNQAAAVIGGGQTLARSNATVWLPRGIAWRLSIFRATKPQMWHKKLTPNMVKLNSVRFALTLTSEQSVLALSRVDEIFGRGFLLVYSAGIAKQPLSATSSSAILTSFTGESGGLFPVCP